MGIFFKDGFWSSKSNKSGEVKSSSKFDYSNVEVEPCGLNVSYPTYNDDYLKYGRNMKYVHIVKLKSDVGEYKAGSKFVKGFDTVIFQHKVKDGGIQWVAETFIIDLTTWKRV